MLYGDQPDGESNSNHHEIWFNITTALNFDQIDLRRLVPPFDLADLLQVSLSK